MVSRIAWWRKMYWGWERKIRGKKRETEEKREKGKDMVRDYFLNVSFVLESLADGTHRHHRKNKSRKISNSVCCSSQGWWLTFETTLK